MITQLLLEPLLFIIFIITCLYLPGKFLLSKLKLEMSPLEDIFLPTGLGIAIFTFISYILSWIRLEILILPFFLVIDFLAIKNTYLPQKIAKLHFIPLCISAVLSIIFSLKMLMTGQYGNNFLMRHDDPWHLALINELKVHFPPDNPGFANIPLKGYHFFYDFFAAKISNLFHISPISLHFHLIPVFSALLWGLGVYTLMFKWTKKRAAGVWAVFLTMFGGSFAFLLYLQGHPEINLDGGLGIGTPIWSLYNPPLTMSLLIIVVSLIMLWNFLRDRRQAWLIPLSLCIGIIAMFKVYAGMIMIGAFLILVVFELFKKNYRIIFALTVIGALFLGTYWLFAGGTGALIYYPMWGPERLLQSFAWYHYDNKMYVYSGYLTSGGRITHVLHGLIGLLSAKIYGLVLFVLGNLGTRLIGVVCLVLLGFSKKRKWPSVFSILLFVMTLISILIPLLFIQTGKVFEIIQMAQYYLFFVALIGAFGFAVFFELKFSQLLKVFLVIVLALMTVPHMPAVFSEYAQEIKSFQDVNNTTYFQMTHYLSTIGNYDDTVLDLPPKEIELKYQNLLGWYYHISTPSLTALADKRTYFDNEFIDFPNIDIRSRIDFLIRLVTLTNYDSAISININKEPIVLKMLKEEGIKYVYTPYGIPLFGYATHVVRIYKDKDNMIYKINY